jgi:glyoxylase-like metal-dependent hydrolase (beta-lactamase superfamily II)
MDGLVAAYGSDPSYVDAMFEKFRKTFSYVPRPDAIGYADGAVWDLGKSRVRAFHMPGHTAGHCVLLVEPEGVAFIGDIDLSGFGPYYGDASSSLGDFRRSLAKLPDIPAKVWVTFHHRGVYTDRDKFLSDLAAYASVFDARDRRLLDLLRASPKTLAQLVDCRLLYPPGHQDFWVVDAETRSISMHLAEMLADGRVRKDESGVYRPG